MKDKEFIWSMKVESSYNLKIEDLRQAMFNIKNRNALVLNGINYELKY